MIKNYFKIAWRNLLKNIGFSAINIFGLSIGIACCLMITLYVTDELSYDRFNTKANQIYRLNFNFKYGGTEQALAQTPDLLGPILKKDYPQVQDFTRIFDRGASLVKKAGLFTNFREEKILYADSSIFNVFTLPLVSGNPQSALTEPNTIVISESAAKRHFNTENPIGQVLTLDNKNDFKVTGVMRDMPENSHFRAEFLMSMRSANYGWNDLLSNNFNTYILIKPGTDPKSFVSIFNQITEKYVSPQLLKAIGSTAADLTKSGSYIRYDMIPLTKIHLSSKYNNELGANGNIQYVYIFSVVALFVLLIACINFMNLSTARSSKRAKEVGIRKVLGSARNQLMFQFFSECVLLSFFALLVALGLVFILLPEFNNLSGKTLSLANLLSAKSVIVLALLPIIVGIIAGSYPAIFLSSFEPIKVLKGRFSRAAMPGGFFNLRNALVVFQFATSLVLIIGTMVVYRQINFIQQKNLGFNKNQVLVINDPYGLGKNARVFKDEVLKLQGVESGTLSGFLPTPSNRSDDVMYPEGENDQSKGVLVQSWDIDEDYIKTLGMQIVSGRPFSKEFPTDSFCVIMNEKAVKLFGYNDPIDKIVESKVDNHSDKKRSYKVIGVVKDFNFESLHDNIGAVCMFLKLSRGNVSFRLDARNDLKGTIARIESKWKEMAPSQPFSYEFMDESFNKVYKTEQKIGKISLSFSILTILVACLGLFGLITFIAEQRIKEIGIRKVLGASVPNIVSLISKDFVKLVLISIVIASPIAYFVMNRWLQDFAYRSTISWWIFALAGFIALLIALLTVSFQAIKAAVANPVKSLRTE